MRLNLQPLNDPKLRTFLPVGAGLAGFVAGAVVGHLYEKRQTQNEAEVIVIDVAALKRDLDASIAEYEDDEETEPIMPPTESDIVRHPASSGPLDLAETIDLDEEVEEEPQLTLVDTEPESDLAEVQNIFERQKQQGWDWEKELAKRTDSAPYIIHEDEYAEQEDETYEQSSLTWYEGDEIMADSRDTPLYRWKDVVGEDLYFGHGSTDSNSFYVRNPLLKGEYEILRDEGSFEEVVLGLTAEAEIAADELKHSKSLRFRPED